MKAYTQAHRDLLAGFGKFSDRILYGCFGCGKTHTTLQAFGIYLLTLNQYTSQRFNFVLVGRTQLTVKRNMCNVLSQLFGTDFKYDGSRSTGKTRDAVLFGHSLFIIGLNDTGAEGRIRGLTDVMGMIHDETSLCGEEQFDLIQGRLRGAKFPAEVQSCFRTGWYLGSTNPDIPKHWILKKQEQSVVDLCKWHKEDAIWDGADEYYAKLERLYVPGSALHSRFVLGNFTGNDLMVYSMFNPKLHVVASADMDIDYAQMRRTFLAVDYGSNHPTAILVLSRSIGGEYVVSRELRLTDTAPSKIVDHISLIYQEFANQGVLLAPLYIDPAAGALKDELRDRNIEYINALNSRSSKGGDDDANGIATVRSALALSKLLIFDTCENLIKEMYSYQFKNANTEDVVKLNDDFADALRYGVHTDTKLGGD